MVDEMMNILINHLICLTHYHIIIHLTTYHVILGLFNALLTVINQLLSPYNYSNDQGEMVDEMVDCETDEMVDCEMR